MNEDTLTCAIYESSRRVGLYLYIREKDDFSDVPEELMKQMGKPRFAMELELTPERRLARADAAEVMQSLHDRGFYLQMPPPADEQV